VWVRWLGRYSRSGSTSSFDVGRRWYGVQAWVGQKLENVTHYEFLRCPFFALGPRFHDIRDILEVIHYNVKLLY
jgi:hypothetical protein